MLSKSLCKMKWNQILGFVFPWFCKYWCSSQVSLVHRTRHSPPINRDRLIKSCSVPIWDKWAASGVDALPTSYHIGFQFCSGSNINSSAETSLTFVRKLVREMWPAGKGVVVHRKSQARSRKYLQSVVMFLLQAMLLISLGVGKSRSHLSCNLHHPSNDVRCICAGVDHVNQMDQIFRVRNILFLSNEQPLF